MSEAEVRLAPVLRAGVQCAALQLRPSIHPLGAAACLCGGVVLALRALRGRPAPAREEGKAAVGGGAPSQG